MKLLKRTLMPLLLALALVLTGTPLEGFALGTDITIDTVEYKRTIDNGITTVSLEIGGTGFTQRVDNDPKGKSRITGIEISDILRDKDNIPHVIGTPLNLMDELAKTAEVEWTITEKKITITAPKTGDQDYTTLNLNVGGESQVKITQESITPGDSSVEKKFMMQVKEQPSMPGDLENDTVYEGEKLIIAGSNFKDVSIINIAGGNYTVGGDNANASINSEGTVITIHKLNSANINQMSYIKFMQIFPNTSPSITYTTEYRDKVMVLPGNMKNLLMVPSEGSYNNPSLVTVYALDSEGNAVSGIFSKDQKLYLRDPLDSSKEYPLTNIEVRGENGKIIAIQGYTPILNDDAKNKTFHLVIKKSDDKTILGISKNAYTFTGGNPSPTIQGIFPSKGSDGGGTMVTIKGKNIIKVATGGITLSKQITPQATPVITDNTMTIKYNIETEGGTPKYGNEEIIAIERKLITRISSLTIPQKMDITTVLSQDTTTPKNHYTTLNEDGLVVVTTNPNMTGNAVINMDIETIIKTKSGKIITIPETARGGIFNYEESSPRPKIDSIEPVFGYYNPVAPVKPLMLRIKGEKFEMLKDVKTGVVTYPDVTFRLPGGSKLPVKISTAIGDIKVLDDDAQIDGIYKTLGDTLVISLYPDPDSGENLHDLIMKEALNLGSFKALSADVVVTNPSGASNHLDENSKKMQFRHPNDTVPATIPHSKQPKIEGVYYNNGSVVSKLSSEEETEVTIKFNTRSGISELKKVLVTLDGKDITPDPKEEKRFSLEGENAVIKAKIDKGFVGKTRLQVILPEGLMDSYDIVFDNIKGPELAPLTPNTGGLGTWVILKRNINANTVSFKLPLEDSTNENERIGSRVLIDGKDINTLLGGYNRVDNKVVYQKSDLFVKGTDPSSDLMLPGKYVYVVDADTIYLYIPDRPDMPDLPGLPDLPDEISMGKHDIKIQNPDGSEGVNAQTFSIIDIIGKTRIGSIDPDRDDVNGGIISTITAAPGTDFKGGVKVYYGTKEATVLGPYPDNLKQVSVKAPPLVDYKFPATGTGIETYTVPVTVINKENKSIHTKPDGFTYFNPQYPFTINRIYKEGIDPQSPNPNKVVAEDYVWIEGTGLRAKKSGSDITDLPIVFIGNTKVQADNYEIFAQGTDRVELSKIRVKIPTIPSIVAADGSVDVLVQNYDGAKAIKTKGVIYGIQNPTINTKNSTLTASRYKDSVQINAQNVNERGLMVAFGESSYKKELGSTTRDFVTNEKGEEEQIIIRYIPGASENIEIYYKPLEGEPILMTDTENTNGGKLSLGTEPGKKTIVGINWKNPQYHTRSDIDQHPERLATLNTEYMAVGTTQDASSNYIVIRRGLGKVKNFKINQATKGYDINIDTPYYDKSEKTKIYLINSDGSTTSADFTFHEGTEPPEITELEGSKSTNVTVEGKPVTAMVRTQDITVEGTLRIKGKFLKDITSVKIGGVEVKVETIAQDYSYIIVTVPKGNPGDVRVPKMVSISTKEGNTFSDQYTPPMYFMYISADSKPVISSITPVTGPDTGGTLVEIKGTGFREKDQFGTISGSEQERITVTINGSNPVALKSVERNAQQEIVGLKVSMPASVKGKAKLQVINADGGMSEPKEYTYVSQPKLDAKDTATFFSDTSAEIKLTGKDFMAGAKVILGGTLQIGGTKPAETKYEGMLGVTTDGINQTAYIVGGVEATAVQVPNESNLSFKFPANIDKLENLSIIIVNPDTGISNPGEGAIKVPIPDVPKITAVPGYEGSIILRWTVDKTTLNAAEKFEIYARERGKGDYAYVGEVPVGTQAEMSYTVKGLKYDTAYDFKVRVLNKYGEAKDFGEVREYTLTASQDYKEKEKQEAVDKAAGQISRNGKQEVIGANYHHTVGTAETRINLTASKQATKYVQIPVADIKSGGNRTLTIEDNQMTLSVNLASLNVPELNSASQDALVRVKIASTDKQKEESMSRSIPRTMKRLTNIYGLSFEIAEPRLTRDINSLRGGINLSMRGTGYGSMAVYTPASDRFTTLNSGTIYSGGYYVLLGNK